MLTSYGFHSAVFNDTEYNTRVAFQVFVKPESYKISGETVAAKETIDPLFTNDELEWSTEEQGATIIYGLLVNLEMVKVSGSSDAEFPNTRRQMQLNSDGDAVMTSRSADIHPKTVVAQSLKKTSYHSICIVGNRGCSARV